MTPLEATVARANPADVYKPGGVLFIAIERVGDLVDEAERRAIAILGFEGFLIDATTVFSSTGRISNYSDLPADETWRRVPRDRAGDWRPPPTPTPHDHVNSEAQGRYMLAVTLDEPSCTSS